jgi:competence protein ComEA
MVPRAALGVSRATLVVAAVAAGALALVALPAVAAAAPAAPFVAAGSDEPGLSASGSPASVSPAISDLRVEISGAVVAPGVYGLAQGARLIDAIEAAGGWNERVDPLRVDICLNLAAPLVDGSAIRVPTRDDRFLLGVDGTACGILYAAPADVARTDAGGTAAAQPSGGKLDLNRATAAELDTLPGIGPVTAAKIIASRAATPFLLADDLVARGLVSDRVLQGIRSLVVP